MDKETNFTAPTAEQLAAWKSEHRVVYQLDCLGRPAWIRKPKLVDLEIAMKASNKPNAKALDFNRSIVQRCALAVHPDIYDGDDREVALYTSVGELAAIKDAEVVKL